MGHSPRSAAPSIALAAALWGCASAEDPGMTQPPSASSMTGGAGEGCPPGETPVERGACRVAGVGAGVPPERCARGFEPKDEGCSPVLPAAACPSGEMALPGEIKCRPIAPCGKGPWGDAPLDATTQHVDAGYLGGGSDGSAAKPWLTIAEAIAAAPPDGLVAIAGGTYVPVILDRPVRVWGRCPSLVGIGGGLASVTVEPTAEGSTIRGVALTGPGLGALVQAADVTFDRVWVHDTGSTGLAFEASADGAEVRDSVVERATTAGILVFGARAEIASTVVRATRPDAMGDFGRGINVRRDDVQRKRPDVSIRDVVVEDVLESGLRIIGGDLTVEASVVRNTGLSASSEEARGINAQPPAPGGGERAVLTVTQSFVQSSIGHGIAAFAADVTIDATLIVDTAPGASADAFGLVIADEDGDPSKAVISQSLLARNAGAAIIVNGSDAEITQVLVRDGVAQAGERGGGISIQESNGRRATATVHDCLVERTREFGIFGADADLTISAVRVSDVAARATDGMFGRGITIQDGARAAVELSVIERAREVGIAALGAAVDVVDTRVSDMTLDPRSEQLGVGVYYQSDGVHATSGRVERSLIERCHTAGIAVLGGDVQIVASRVDQIMPNAGGLFGDGLGAIADPAGTSVTVTGSTIAHAARAGVATFGAPVSLHSTTFECNPIDLNAEDLGGLDGAIEDGGENACGCAGEAISCTVLHTELEPPEPLSSGE